MSQELVLNRRQAQGKAAPSRPAAYLARYGMLLVLLGLMVLMSILSPNFLTTSNLLNIVRQMSVVGILAIGVTFVIISGGIDLSSGSLVALVSVVVASMVKGDRFPVLVAVPVALATGLVAGLVNGTVIAKGRIAPFIVTLGMMTAARGAALLYTGGYPIGNLSESFKFIGHGNVFGIPVPVLIFLAVGVLAHVVLTRTKFGKYVYAIGGNEQAAVIAGVDVDRYKILIYGLAGVLSALGGVILTARVASGQPTAGLMYELDAVTAAVIGGTSLSGGIGSVGGTVVGALVIGVMNNGLDLLNVSSYWQQILKGVIFTVAVLIDSRKHRRR